MATATNENRDTLAVKLLAYLFSNYYCPANEVDESRRHLVALTGFWVWARQILPERDLDYVALCRELDIPHEIWGYVQTDLLDDILGIERLLQVWPSITTYDRPAPQAKILGMSQIVTIFYTDGTARPLASYLIPRPGDRDKVTDGFLAGAFTESSAKLRGAILADGIDRMHAEAADMRGKSAEHPYDVLMGAILKIMPQLQEEYRPYLRNWMNLLGSIAGPIVSPPKPVKAAAVPSLGAVGGWNRG